jgi:hypothetical protein
MNNNDSVRLQVSIIFLQVALVGVTAIVRRAIGSVTWTWSQTVQSTGGRPFHAIWMSREAENLI